MSGKSDDILLLSKAQDTIELSYKRNSPCFFGFLNETEVQTIKDNLYLDDTCTFYGGYDDAQRVIFSCGECSKTEYPLVPVKFLYKKEYQLSHRDFLGALMSTGIERSTIGDILTGEGETIVFVKSEIVNHILGEISKIGRIGVKLSVVDVSDVSYTASFDEIPLTVSSLRIDVVVSALCRLSRDSSQKLIKSELVAVNHKVNTNVSKPVVIGDVISIRKFGKFVFADDNGFSKKGKHRITVKHFR